MQARIYTVEVELSEGLGAWQIIAETSDKADALLALAGLEAENRNARLWSEVQGQGVAV